MWLAERLVREGFIVAAVDHHGNTGAEPSYIPAGFVLWWERAADLSFVLGALLNDPEWSPRIDVGRIGAAGFSLGGFTAMLLATGPVDLARLEAFCGAHITHAACAGPPEMPDARARFEAVAASDPELASWRHDALRGFRNPRIRAVFLVSPGGEMGLSPEALRQVRIPVTVTVGADDDLTPPQEVTAFARSIGGGAPVRIIPHASHYSFLAECTAAGVRILPQLCTEPEGGDRARTHEFVANQAAAFFAAAFGRAGSPPRH
jgi:predicted dienelactone hydrolase